MKVTGFAYRSKGDYASAIQDFDKVDSEAYLVLCLPMQR